MYITKTYNCVYIPLSIKSISTHTSSLGLSIRGSAATYNYIDSCNDVIMPSALDDFLLNLNKIGGYNIMPSMRYEHISYGKPIGIWKSIINTETDLKVEGVVYSEMVIQEILKGELQGLSIGFYAEKYEIMDDIRYLHKIYIDEISLVKEPANQTAFCAPKESVYYVRSVETYKNN